MPHREKQPPLRVGLLVESKFVTKYAYELAKLMEANDGFCVSYLVIEDFRPKCSKEIFKPLSKHEVSDLIKRQALNLVSKLEYLMLRRFDVHKDHLKVYNLEDITQPLTLRQFSANESGIGNSSDLKKLGLDLIIDLCRDAPRRELVSLTKLGVVYLDYCDSRVNRSGPPGFWETYLRLESTGFSIQHIRTEADASQVLMRGNFATKHFYLLNQAVLYKRGNAGLMEVLERIADGRNLSAAEELRPFDKMIIRTPSLIDQITYFMQRVVSVSINYFSRSILKRRSSWGVAFSNCNWDELVMCRATKIANPENHFLADPFVISNGDENFCFVEDFDRNTNLGSIAVYTLRDNAYERAGTALQEPFHMSFPYLFRFENKLYMCPETAANNDIRIYECVNFPLKWKLSNIAMKDVSAADTIIFEFDGVWWLFTNIDCLGCGDYPPHCYELHIFYSSNPLNGQWIPHPKNPVFSDSSRARNGGILFRDGCIYRVAQKQGFGTYGKALSINRICVLSRNEYAEECTAAIGPTFFKEARCTHHMHSNNRITVFDYCSYN